MWDVDEDIDGGAATDTDKDDSQDPRPDFRGGKREEHSCFLDTFADDINEDDDIEEVSKQEKLAAILKDSIREESSEDIKAKRPRLDNLAKNLPYTAPSFTRHGSE